MRADIPTVIYRSTTLYKEIEPGHLTRRLFGGIGVSGRSTLGDAAEGADTGVREYGRKPRALAASAPSRAELVKEKPGSTPAVLKNRLDLAFAKDLGPMRV